MFDLSIFTTPEAWISLVMLMFLEVVLGVDNIVFISITTDRLPPEKQHIGRKLGLAGAMIMRILFLSAASYLVHLTKPIPIFESWGLSITVRSLVLFAGGAYLIVKGVTELIREIRGAGPNEEGHLGESAGNRIGLVRAVAIIMVMDVVFSIDSVITAVGLVDYLIIMIIAVIVAVLVMMAFIDPIAEFINSNSEMKILALVFIAVIGVLLVLESLGIESGFEVLGLPLEKLVLYLAMLLTTTIVLLILRRKANLEKYNNDTEGFED